MWRASALSAVHAASIIEWTDYKRLKGAGLRCYRCRPYPPVLSSALLVDWTGCRLLLYLAWCTPAAAWAPARSVFISRNGTLPSPAGLGYCVRCENVPSLINQTKEPKEKQTKQNNHHLNLE